MLVFFGAWILLAVVMLVTQMRFYNAHQRSHHDWRPRSNRWVMARSGAEYRAMLHATFRADPDSTVESLRRQYVAMLIIAVAYLLVGSPIVVLVAA